MKKILIIEDDKVMRENTAEILELSQYEVKTAENGKLGINLAKEFKPDLIICDIMMPELDGFGVIHILAKDPKTAAIPFIFLTAKAEKSDRRKGMDLGADDYLTKPFEDTDLLNAIEARLKKIDLIKKDTLQNIEQINEFIDSARGLEELHDLSHDKSLTKYKKKQIIYSEGDTPHYLYYLHSGKVKIFKTHDDGKEYVIDIYKEGDFFGLNPLFENSKYLDTALVLENCEIRKIPKEDFLALLQKNQSVAAKFIQILSKNIEERERQLLSFAYDTIRKRAADALVQLESKFREEGQQETKVRITRDDLAGMAGTATETVIRCLGDFKNDNLIEVHGREIVILDVDGLSNIRY